MTLLIPAGSPGPQPPDPKQSPSHTGATGLGKPLTHLRVHGSTHQPEHTSLKPRAQASPALFTTPPPLLTGSVPFQLIYLISTLTAGAS